MITYPNSWKLVPGELFEVSDELRQLMPAGDNQSGEIKFKKDPITNEELLYDVDEVSEIYRSYYKIDLPYVFDTIKTITPRVTRSFLVYARHGSTVRKHFHPPVLDGDNNYIRNRHTVTFGVPCKITEPVTDRLFFSRTDQDYFTSYKEHNTDWFSGFRWHKEIVDKATEITDQIPFPNENQYLLLDFDSTCTVHWADHKTMNEYFFIVYEL